VAANHTADTIAKAPNTSNTLDHPGRCFRIRAADRISFNLLKRGRGAKFGHGDGMNPLHIGDDTNASAQQESLSSDCPGSYTANGLASTGTSSALYSPNAILGVVGKISMRRTILL